MKNLSQRLIDFLVNNDCREILQDLYDNEGGKDYFDLSYSDESKISYLTENRLPEDESLIYSEEYRKNSAYHTKIGKLLSENVSNTLIQKISSIMSARKIKHIFKLELTDNICHSYNEENYSNDHGKSGHLHNSCMRYNHLQDAIRFYENIGNNKLKLLICYDENNKIVGRALLWYGVLRNDENITYLDRIYTSNDNIKQLFLDYAEKNKYITRDENNCNLNFNVLIDHDVPLPYFDTFRYYNKCGVLTNNGGDVCLESVEGDSINEIHLPYNCDSCGCDMHEDEALYSDRDGVQYCDSCGVWIAEIEDVININDSVQIDGTYYHKESEKIVYSDYEDDYILADECSYSEAENVYFSNGNDDFVYSDYEDDYILAENCIYSDYENDYLLKINVLYSHIDDDNYKIEDVIFSKFHNSYILKSDSVYIDFMDDHFLESAECIYYNDTLKKYMHKQYSLMIV